MRVYEAQLRELLTNYGKIDVLWFDGGDAPHFGLVDYPREAWQADRLEKLVREMQPGTPACTPTLAPPSARATA